MKKNVHTSTARFILAASAACLLLSVAVAPAQTAGTWNGGTGNWSNGALWTPAGAPAGAGADVYIDGANALSSIVTMDSSFGAGRITIDANDTLNVADSTVLTIFAGGFAGAGILLNNGHVSFGSGASWQFSGSVTLAGTGTLTLDNSGTDVIVATTYADLLTIGAGQTIQGSGNIGNGYSTVTNNGTILANQSAHSLIINAVGGATVDLTNGATGTLRATGGGTLQINGGRFTNNGTLQADASSQIQFNGVSVLGGTLAADASSAIHSAASSFTDVTNNGHLILDDGGTSLVGTFTNNATITYASSNLGLVLSGNVTLAGTGTLTLDSSGTNTITAAVYGDLLTIGANQTIQGAGNIGNGYTTVTNNGTILANQSAHPLIINAVGGATVDLTNSATGILRATGGSTLQISGGRFTNNGSLQADTNSLIQLNGVSVLGGTLAADVSSAIHSASSVFTNVTNSGHLILDDSGTSLVGTFTNNANITYAGPNLGLILAGNVTLAGTGTLTLDSSGTNVISAAIYGDLLTIGASQTIQGAGHIANGYTSVTNNGTILANQPANPLIISAVGGATVDLTNSATGTLRATGGSTLQISGGRFTNNGSLQADTNSLIQLNGVSVLGGTLAADASSAIHSAASSFTDVTNSGHLILDDSGTSLVGTFTNNANITYAGTNLGLTLSGNVTLAGTGTLTLGSSGTNVISAAIYGDLLTIGASQTIQGAGHIGNGYTSVTNNGTILANQPANPLIISAVGGATVDLTNSATGTLRATGGSSLWISGGRFTNNGSLLADSNSQIQLNNVSVLGGTLAADASSAIHSASSLFTNVTNNGHLILDDGGTTLAGTLTNNATITFASSNLALTLSGNVTLAGTGTLTLDSSGTDTIATAVYGDLLTVGASQTIQGAGHIGNGYTSVTNHGTILAYQSAQPLIINAVGGGAADLTNSATGTLRATGGSTLQIISGRFTNSGVLDVQTGSTIDITPGSLTNFPDHTLTGGTYNVTSTGSVATLTMGGGSISTNAAQVSLSGSTTVFAEIDALASNQGRFAIANGRDFTTLGNLANTGTLVADTGSTLAVNGALSQSASGTLAGSGTFVATAFTLAGTVAPGSSPGTLTLAGTAAFDPTLRLAFELGSLAGPNDHLHITGDFTLDGTLDVTALAGFGAGIYELIDYGGGTFTNHTLVLGAAPAGFDYQIVTTTPGEVDLVVSGVPEPSAWAMLVGTVALFAGCQRFGRRRSRWAAN